MTATAFAAIARALGDACGEHELRRPAYRSPPKRRGVDRALMRLPEDRAVVAVRIRDRGDIAVIRDMVEGTLVANGREKDDPLNPILVHVANTALHHNERKAS